VVQEDMTVARGATRTVAALLCLALGAPAGSAAEDLAPSPAHRLSREVVIDPTYSADAVAPEPDVGPDGAPWLYGYGELETWQHRRLRQRVDRALLHVHYPGVFHEPFSRASFRVQLPAGEARPADLSFRAVGAVRVKAGGTTLYEGPAQESPHRVPLPAGCFEDGGRLRLDLDAGDEPPALRVETGPLATAGAHWEWSSDGLEWDRPASVPDTRSATPPHRSEIPEVVLEPVGQVGDVLDFGRELIGRISFRAGGVPSIVVGESLAEARNDDPKGYEQDLTLVREGGDRWVSQHRLALRYLRIPGEEARDVRIHAAFHPVRYRGAFASSDERLNRIWMSSAYTLRLCLYEFIIDGVKRDRLPWTGDLAMSLLANAYSFAEAETVRRTLIALGRAGIAESHINGIVDYSLWWVIAQDLFQLYYGDAAFLERQWPYVADVLARLEAGADDAGLLAPRPDDWVFIDWVEQEKLTALQVLWWWAQESGARLGRRVGDNAAAAHWQGSADALAETLRARAWDEGAGGWLGKPVAGSPPSRHANLLAVVSGLHRPADDAVVRELLAGSEAPPVGTPYMTGFEIMAASRLGAIDAPLARLRRYWGGMLDQGATTFWEAYDPSQGGEASLAFYRRPFGKSLCHAWGAGPAAILPAEILGVRPTKDGWSEFTVEPRPGPLSWVTATVPTPSGRIEIDVRDGRLTVGVPPGSRLRWRGETHVGPATLRRSLWESAPAPSAPQSRLPGTTRGRDLAAHRG